MSYAVSTAAAMASVSASAHPKVAPQGGILEGANPSHFDPKNPIILFIIQAGIIIVFCRLLHFPLSKIRQPRVIAEVIGGILLGPSVMGRIPGFSNAIFPAASLPTLNMAANLGLILFLFLVGLEVDLRLFQQNWKIALSVGAAGMVLPFGLGCAIAYGLYHQFSGDAGTIHISFGVYMLFIGVAMAITAFPVLCRILTELKLLHTTVGVIVLSAGVGNDVVGWILLALCVALVNAGTGLTALYVLLTCVAYILFLAYAVRPAFLWILHRTGSIQNGPTQSVVALTVLMVLVSAFFTGIIGVHPIFGGFLIGLLCPHDGGFAIKLTEKIEDLVSVLLLPLYFALSGLSTNIGLLNNGITWAYVIGVVSIAFGGKILGGTIAARSCKLVWRESFTIGVLMSCKGLVELIVLNIGLQAKILSTRTFTIFVVMALITTFATTPLTAALYPPWYQKKLAAWKRGEIDWDSGLPVGTASSAASDKDTLASSSAGKASDGATRKLLVYLRLDSLSSLFTFMALLGHASTPSTTVRTTHPSRGKRDTTATVTAGVPSRERPLEVHGLRLVELTERTSSVMHSSSHALADPIISCFQTFGSLHNIAISGALSIVPESSYAESLVSRAVELASDLILIPWSETGSVSEHSANALLHDAPENRFSSVPHNEFILDTLRQASCNTAVLVNRGFGGATPTSGGEAASDPAGGPRSPGITRMLTGLSIRSTQENLPRQPIADRSHHVFFPFFGRGTDDRVALRFVLQLASNPNVTATILHVISTSTAPDSTLSPTTTLTEPSTPITPGWPSDAVDPSAEIAFLTSLRDSLPAEMTDRVLFVELSTATPLAATIQRAKEEVGNGRANAGDLVVVGRRTPGLRDELLALAGHTPGVSHHGGAAEMRKALGDVGEAMVGGVSASVVVIQAGGRPHF